MTLLFVPGFMADETLWTEVIAQLRTSDVAHARLTQGDTIDEMARLALAAAPGRFDLVGFSMGGYVARAMARIAPERVQRLVLVATSARADTPAQAQRKAAAVKQLSAAVGFSGLSRASIQASLHPSRAADEAWVERVRAMGVRLGKDVFLRQSSVPRDSDLHLLSQIRCPTRVVAAREDRLRSLEEARELSEGIPGAQLQVIEGCGHMIPLEDPVAVARAIAPIRP